MPKISIIVPIYNVEKYLEKCIKSILNQTFKDFELILVDDGSPDKCGEICEKYKALDSRVRVVHKSNAGLSAARNTGLDLAKGDFVAFVDSDDYVHKQMYEILYSQIIKDKSDITICDFEYVYENKNIDLLQYDDLKKGFNIETFNKIEALEQIDKKDGVKFVIACNKLYKIELFNVLRFEEGRIHEDELMAHKIIYKSKKITFINCKLYHYLQRENSITKEHFSLKKLDALHALKDRMNFYRNKKIKNLQITAEFNYINSFFKYYYKVKYSFNDVDRELEVLRKDFKKSLKYILKNPRYNWKEKIMWIIFCINPNIHEMYITKNK